jgi:outer membrane lipoprotein-sorting protein
VKRNWSIVCVLGVVGALAALPALPAALTAAQLVERNVAARGGLEAWRAVTSITMSGQTDVGGKQDTQVPFVLTLARPHKSRLELTFNAQTAVQVYDGTQGWKVRPFLNRNDVEPFTAAEAKVAAAAAELDGPLIDYVRKGSKIDPKGMDTVEGKKAYKLLLTTQGGEQQNVWLDESSFLEVKIDGEPRKLDGKPHKVAIYYRDYRTVSGLKVPYTIETAVEGVPKTQKMHIETVTVNPPVEATLFAKPRPAATQAAAR